MLPTIPITSEPYVTILKGLEKPVTGIAHAKRDDDGVMIIDNGGGLIPLIGTASIAQ